MLLALVIRTGGGILYKGRELNISYREGVSTKWQNFPKKGESESHVFRNLKAVKELENN